MKLLILVLGIASCGIGWGQDAHACPKDCTCHDAVTVCPFNGPRIISAKPEPLPECTSKLVDGVWVISDIPAKGCKIHSECEGDECHHKNPQSLLETPPITTPMMTFTNSVTCDEQVAFRGRVKTLRELFPDECKPQTGDHQ